MSQMKFPSEELRSLPPRPPGSLAASTRRRFVKLGRKTSDGSQQSASSTGSSSTGRSAEGVAIRQPSKSRIHPPASRLSGVFRGPASPSAAGSMALTASIRSSLSSQSRKASMISADALIADDPSELSNQITAPGILKIFGNEICEGAHYKSVLATTHSSARELVKEALERYGLNKQEAESYVLCDTIGSIGDHQWKTEGFRVVGDNEKPLLLQSLWKPRDGMARRFEIQKRSSAEEKTSKDKDTVTAGINAQARKLQKSRSRVTSTLIERTMGRGHKLWRSRSEMDLIDSDGENEQECVKNRSDSLNPTALQSYERPTISPQQNHIHSAAGPPEGDGGSRAKTETLCPSGPKDEGEGEESEREETESSDDHTTQYSIHPPHDCPYLLLLQGCSPAQDFVIYLLVAPSIVIGHGHVESGSKPDIVLFAADVLPRHCCLHRRGGSGPTTLCPYREARVTRNGETLGAETQLTPGDVIGLGQRYLFLFRDPLALTQKEVDGAAPELRALGETKTMSNSSACIAADVDAQARRDRAPLLLKSAEGHSLTLSYEAEQERRLVEEIAAMGSGGAERRPPLTVAFLLCVCLQHSSTCLHTSDLRRLLLLIASEVQSAVWIIDHLSQLLMHKAFIAVLQECTKDLAADQPEALDADGLRPVRLQDMVPGLGSLVVWMSNSLELLHFIQHQVPVLLERRTSREGGEEDDGQRAATERHLPCVRSASEETVAVLEEVVMLAFQQCVYYITKVLYPILPGLLDCNPFRQSPGPQVPGEIQHIVEVLTDTWRLLSDSHVHPDICSQLVGLLFYFINASVFNSLMERGSEPGFYQWSTGVRMRANLDLLLDWANETGLGELASEQTQKLSSAVNLLATPRKNLLQTSWASLRSDYAALNLAQLNHLLSLYSPACPQSLAWSPSALTPADVLENFDTHHPLVLPDGGHQLQLTRPVRVSGVREQLDKLKEFIASLSQSGSNNISAAAKHQGGSSSMEPKPDTLPNAGLESLEPSLPETVSPQVSAAFPPSPSSPPSPPSPPSHHYLDEFSSCVAVLLSQKLRNLELLSRDMKTSALDPSCLLTPPNTPHVADPGDPAKAEQDDEGGLVSECLAALKVDPLKTSGPSMTGIVELKEEEDEQEGQEEEDCYDEVFSLELERGDRGLGLALVDAKDSSLTAKGVFIRAVLPDSPAARCEKLEPGDRILAVNGVSLLGLDNQSGRELIQSSGDRLRLLVARADWMAKAVHTEG